MTLDAVTALLTLLTSATVLSLGRMVWKGVKKMRTGAPMGEKDIFTEMRTQRDEALDENELLRTERDQALRMVARRDRVLIVEGVDIPDDKGDTPYKPPPREPRREPRKRKSPDGPQG